MYKKVLLLAVAVIVTSLFSVSAAEAKVVKLFVTPKYGITEECRTPGVYGFRFTFGAKFTRRNSPYPKSVKFKYTVTDLSTGGTVTSGRATITKRGKWKAKSKPIRLTAPGTYQYRMEGSFKSPQTGKTIRGTDILPPGGSERIPTDAEMDAAGVVLPACV